MCLYTPDRIVYEHVLMDVQDYDRASGPMISIS